MSVSTFQCNTPSKKKGVKMKIFIFTLLLFTFLACYKSADITEPVIGEEFNLKYGHSAHIQDDNTTIKFIEIKEDSRCPAGAICKWEGNVKVILKISNSELEINSNTNPQFVGYDDSIVKLISVTPYPKLKEKININDYVIKLVVTKK
jgi:hypothetical protein